MPTQLLLDVLQPLEPGFDNFVPGRNAAALDALRRLAAGRLPERQVYLWGAAGSGRSHLLAAVARASEAAWTWSPDEDPERPGIAVAAAIDTLDEPSQIALFNRLNAVRMRLDAACAMSGAAAPAQVALRADLRTRLALGQVFEVHPLTDAEKADALRARAAARGMALADDLVPYLLRHLPRDMRTLAAVLDALDAYALSVHRPLTVPLLREWLQDSGFTPRT